MTDQDKYLPIYLTDPSIEEEVPDYDEQIFMSVAFFLLKHRQLDPAITVARLQELLMFALVEGAQISSRNRLDEIGKISTFIENQWEADGFFIEIQQIEGDFNEHWKKLCRETLISEVTFEDDQVIAGTLVDFETAPIETNEFMETMRKAIMFDALGSSLRTFLKVTLASVAKESDVEILDEQGGKFQVFDPEDTEIAYTAIGGRPRIRFQTNHGPMFMPFGSRPDQY